MMSGEDRLRRVRRALEEMAMEEAQRLEKELTEERRAIARTLRERLKGSSGPEQEEILRRLLDATRKRGPDHRRMPGRNP